MKRITQKEWKIISDALAHLGAGEWSELVDDDVDLKDIERVHQKVMERKRPA